MSRAIDQLVTQFVADLNQGVESSVAESVRMALLGIGQHGNGTRTGARRMRSGEMRDHTGRSVSPARRLQGQYLGRLRALRGRDRDRVRAIAKEKGVAHAVREAKRILGR
jgi:hypothetical protein